MIQTVLVIVLFLAAAFWLGRKLYLNLSGRQSPGCEKCAAKELAQH